MLKMKELCVKIDLKMSLFWLASVYFLFSWFTSINQVNVFLLIFLTKMYKMYAYNKNTCLKLRNICFAKFIDSLKITSQVIRFASQFEKCKVRINILVIFIWVSCLVYMYVFFIYTISICILCVLQKELSFTESNQQVCDLYKRVIFQKQRLGETLSVQ